MKHGLSSCVGLILLFVVSAVGGSIIGGWVLSVMWEWFIVPTFDAPRLSIPVAIGISMVAGMLTHQRAKSVDDKSSNTSSVVSELLSITVITPLLTLFVAWIVYQFV